MLAIHRSQRNTLMKLTLWRSHRVDGSDNQAVSLSRESDYRFALSAQWARGWPLGEHLPMLGGFPVAAQKGARAGLRAPGRVFRAGGEG
jgi:hypothetical protein